MTPGDHLTQSLRDLIEQLRHAGHAIGVQQHLDAQRLILQLALLDRLPEHARGLEPYLAPLLCNSPAQQAAFPSYFQPWAERLGELDTVPVEIESNVSFQHEEPKDTPKPVRFSKTWQVSTLFQFLRDTLSSLAVMLIAALQFIPRLFGGLFLVRRRSRAQKNLAHIRIDTEQTAALFNVVDLSRSAQRIRRHIDIPTRQLNIRATLDRSLRAGKRLIPVYRTRKRLPEYLALIDRATLHDHQAQHATALLSWLQTAENVIVERWYFDNDPRYCYPDADNQLYGEPLDALFEHYPEHRLLLFSNGAGLFDALTGQLEPWLEQLLAWGQPALFSPVTPDGWQAQQQTLRAENLLLFSADENGLTAFAALLEKATLDEPLAQLRRPALPDGFPALLARRPRRWLSDTAPDEAVIAALLQQLRDYLQDDVGFHWLVACAVYPELRWPITLELGRALLQPGELGHRLNRLLPLPWFRHGQMPDWWRQALRDTLSTEKVDQLHEMLTAILERDAPADAPDGVTFVFREGKTTDDVWRDQVFLSVMGDDLAFGLPRRWRKQLQQALQPPIADEEDSTPDTLDEPAPAPSFQAPRLIPLPGGTFSMGSEAYDDEKPPHEVTVSPFAMVEHPVTVGEYLRFVEATGTHHPEWMEPGSEYNVETGSDDHYKQLGEALTDPNCPVVGVSWHDAQAYCTWLSAETGEPVRLPTEAEWEYACRAGSSGRWCFGDDESLLDEYAWYRDNADGQTHPVKQKQPNAFGLFDMHGNVWEWCQDWYSDYDSAAQVDPVGPDSGDDRVLRGGAWYDDAVAARCADRGRDGPDGRLRLIGFRLASGQIEQSR